VPSREVYSDLTFKELISLREELEFHTPPSVSEQSANPLLLNDLHPSILRPPCVRVIGRHRGILPCAKRVQSRRGNVILHSQNGNNRR